MNHPRRNDFCPCGSGLKYKKCCLLREDGLEVDSRSGEDTLARAYKEMGDGNWTEAIVLFKEALNSEPHPHTILEAIGGCHDATEDYLTAAEYFEKAIACCPSSRLLELKFRLGVARGCGDRLERAEETFRECLHIQANSEIKATISQILSKLELAREGKINPQFILVEEQLQRAFSDMDDERYRSAASRLEKIVKIDPENAEIFYNLGVVYTFLKNEDVALDHFLKCIQLDSEYAPAYYNMGQINLLKKKDFSQALHFFDMATLAYPEYIGAHHQRAIAYELLGNPLKALECLKKTLELDPENSQARENVQRILTSMNKQGSETID